MRINMFQLFLFALSVVMGIIFAMFFINYNRLTSQVTAWQKKYEVPHADVYRNLLKSRGLTQISHWVNPKANHLDGAETVNEDIYLKNNIQVLCFVTAKPEPSPVYVYPFIPQMVKPLPAVRETWGKRCTKFVIFCEPSQFGPSEKGSDMVFLKAHDGSTWLAMHEIFSHIFKNRYHEQFDWFIHLEIDNFLIYENLLYYLSVYDPSEALYLGHPYQNWGMTYNADGAGYILSNGALRILRRQLTKGQCGPSSVAGDLMLGKCLSEAGVTVADTRDHNGRARFLMYQPETLLVPGNLPWTESFWTYSTYISNEVPPWLESSRYGASYASFGE